MEYKILNNGVEMPMLGLGVYQMPPEDTERCVAQALAAGYRLIDTAQAYGNEEGVGAAIAKSGVPRDEVFVTSKIWVSNMNYARAASSIDESLRALIQSDVVVIPKTAHRARMEENIDVFDFELDADDLAAFTTLDDPAFPRIFDHFDVGTVRWMLEELVRTQQLGGAPLY